MKRADGAQLAANRRALWLVPAGSVPSNQNICTLKSLQPYIHSVSDDTQSDAPFCKVAISYPLSEMATV